MLARLTCGLFTWGGDAMRAILDVNNPQRPVVLRVCGSRAQSISAMGNLQCMRALHRKRWRLAVVELTTTRHVGDVVPPGEYVTFYEERNGRLRAAHSQ